MKITKRYTTVVITLSVLLMALGGFLYAGHYLSPKTFANATEEQQKKYSIITDLLFYTGLLGIIDGIWRRYRLNKQSAEGINSNQAYPKNQAIKDILFYMGLSDMADRIQKRYRSRRQDGNQHYDEAEGQKSNKKEKGAA